MQGLDLLNPFLGAYLLVRNLTNIWEPLHNQIMSHGAGKLMIDQAKILDMSFQFSSVQPLSHVCLFVTPWIAAWQTSLSITNTQNLLKLMSIKSVMLSNHLILCHPFLLLPSIFPIIRVFTNESVLCIRWPEYWSFSFNINPSKEYLWLISFRMNWLDLLAFQGILQIFHNTTVQRKKFFSAQLSLYSNSHIHS